MARSILQDVLSVGRSKVASIVFGLGATIIIARYLGPELNGRLSALLVYPSLFMTFGALGIRKSSAFFIGTATFEELSIYRSTIQLWVFSSIFCSIVSFGLIFFTMATRPSMNFILLAISPIPFALLNTYLSGIYLGKNLIKEFNQINWLPRFFTFIGTVVFIIVIKLGIAGALIAQALAQFFMSIILVSKIGLNQLVSFRVEPKVISQILKLGVAFASALLLINLNYRADIIMMERLSNDFEIGIYSKGSRLMQYLWQIPMLLGTIVFARSANAKDRKKFSLLVCRLLRLSLILIFLGCITLAILSKPIILLLFGKAFLPSAKVMLWLLPGVLLLTIFKVLNMDISGQGKPWFVFKSMGPALLINLILNYLWLPAYGALGAALSSTISYTIGAVLFIWQYSNFTGIPIKEILRYESQDFEVLQASLKKLKLFKKR